MDDQPKADEPKADEPKKKVSDSLREWGIDVGKFEERARESLESARGDLSEITGTLRHTLVQAKDILVSLQTAGSPAATELKSGFERAWREIEAAFKAAREKAKQPPPPAEDASSDDDTLPR